MTSGQVTRAMVLDGRTCARLDAAVRHLAVSSVGWSPIRDPFDAAISTKIGLLSRDLQIEAAHAGTRHVGLVIASNARAFDRVAQAMHTRDKAQVTRAIATTRVAYRRLKQVCTLR